MDKLQEICLRKKADIAPLIEETPLSDIRRQAESLKGEGVRGFYTHLCRKKNETGKALIAEIKKASPSKGLIRENFDVEWLAQSYARAGAACLSVLTNKPYFQGDNDNIMLAKRACDLPILRKDFMVDKWQIYQSRLLGADCILLIMAALNDGEAQEMEEIAHSLHMDVLIETHNRSEIERALTYTTSPLIGVNNRDLKSLKVDLQVGEEMLKYIPNNRLAVAESGLNTPADLARMAQGGAHCYLIGESLMRQDDVEQATRDILQ